MEIVEMTDDMVDEVRALMRLVFSEPPWQADEVQDARDQQFLRDPTMVWYVATENDRVAGFIGGYVGPPIEVTKKFDTPQEFLTGTKIGYKAFFGVSPEFRGNGRRVGHTLTTVLLDHFETAHVDHFLVATMEGTNNYPRYVKSLATLGKCPNGLTYFGYNGVPTEL